MLTDQEMQQIAKKYLSFLMDSTKNLMEIFFNILPKKN